MATGTRLRYDGIETYLAADLDAGVTTIFFDGPLQHSGGVALGSLPGVEGDEYMALTILDAEYRLAEIVHLTGYVEGETFGTIERGQEGTADVSHPTGNKVVHGTTVSDFLDVQDHETDPDAHKAYIDAQIAATIAAERADHEDEASDPHPYYVASDNATFDGPAVFQDDVTFEGTVTIAAGGQLVIEGDLVVNGRLFINGRELVISNDPPVTNQNIVWIQTFG